MSINKVMLSGNLTRMPELKRTSGGTAILSFGIAVNDRRRGQNGNWYDYDNFFDCNIFGKRAESLSKYLSKGMKVAIEGSLHYSSWEDKNGGGRRSRVDINVDDLEFMSSGKRDESCSGSGKADCGEEQTLTTDYVNSIAEPYDGPVPGDCPSAYNDKDIPF